MALSFSPLEKTVDDVVHWNEKNRNIKTEGLSIEKERMLLEKIQLNA